MNLLEEIIAHKRGELTAQRARRSLEELRDAALATRDQRLQMFVPVIASMQ